MEARHLEDWGYGKNALLNAPAVLLTREQHKKISNLLYEQLPKGGSYSKDRVRKAYEQVYKDYPEWIEQIKDYLK